jgi:hypothetical protein
MLAFYKKSLHATFIVFSCLALGLQASAQSNSAPINGTVLDPTGAVVAKATVEVHNPVSHFDRSTTTDTSGKFSFSNVPFNPYHLSVTAAGFASYAQDVDVRSAVPLDLNISLKVTGSSTTVTVEAGEDLLENDPTAHTDVSRELFDKIPLESSSSSLSSLVTLSTPGIAADSNGLFHGLGDHAENSFSIDGQPITDQQSKVFSNQFPIGSIQSLEVLQGAPPAEYGGKTSLVIVATTRSGQGATTPHGDLTASYGSFGTSNVDFNLAYGGQKWGNFISANALQGGRFLDPPEFAVMHDKGNEENLFDRGDYQFTTADSIHLNFGYSRSWFQNPNTFDQQFHTCNAGFTCVGGQAVNPVTLTPLGSTDQRSKIGTFNIAPSWTHVLSTNSVFNLGAFVRRDQYNYYPSADPFADLSPDLQAQTITQDRKLTNAGLRADVSYAKGIHNIKLGATYQQTFLTEHDTLATVDPGFLPLFQQFDPTTQQYMPGTSCLDPVTGAPIALPCTTLALSDLTGGGIPPRGTTTRYAPGSPFTFHGHTDIKETAFYLQDSITKGSWAFNLGVRGDIYDGFVKDGQAQPRLGIAYNVKATNTILRLSYARTLESPFNENLVIASTGCGNPVIAFMVPPPNIPCISGPIRPGWRNEFHAGLQQAFGKYVVVDGEYIWKYTHGSYDFGVVAASPIAFPIEWHNSKIPGYTLRVSVPNYHGFTALVVMSSVAARFFPPQVGGVPFLPAPAVFRIDHDEKFNQTTHFQYQPWKTGPWVGFNWRYDSGLVAGSIPCSAPTATCFASTSPADGGGGFIPGTTTPLPQGQVGFTNNITTLPLTADQEFQSGLTCDGKLAAPNPFGPALATCDAAGLGSIYVKIPAPGKENDDHNPQRIAPRNLFDVSVGDDNLLRGDHYRWSLRLTAINVTNKKALYNFFSTFSGTHYVTPRSLTAEIGFHF